MRCLKFDPRLSVCCILLGAGAPLVGDMVSPDGKWVAYTIPAFDDDANLFSEIFLKATDETPPRSLGKVAGELDQVTWIGNGQIALSQYALANQFAVLETTGKRLPDIVLPPKCDVIYMTLSPDAQNVAFTGWRNVGEKREYGLFVWRLGQNEVRLLIEKELKSRPAWSPDSRQLAIGVARGYAKNYPLQVVDITTGNVDDTGVFGVGANWSPDGKLVACTTAARRGGSWLHGIPTDGKLGLYDVKKRTMQILGDTDGATMPAWSGTGIYVAYLSGGSIWILTRSGGKHCKVYQFSEGLGQAQLAWAGDSALYIRTKTSLERVEVPNTALVKIAEWDTPRAPEPKPEDFKLVELPRVTVRYARFARKYAEAFGNILAEALNVYESLGFKMPLNIKLEAQIDPSGNQLWTDGESQIFLHLQSNEVLAPASRTGVFNLYGMAHELGHIAMYRNLKSLMGLPPGIGEGWAHYAGSIVVSEVAAKLGKSTWPEYYDIAKVEGTGRLQKQFQSAQPWDKMDPTTRAALVFYRIEIESGRDILAAAMSAALAERPAGKDLMPLVLAKLRQATNPTAADWIPESVLVPRVEWMTKEPKPGDDFFADQKQEQDFEGCWLFYDDGTMEGKQSMTGSAETMLFRLPEGSWQLDGIKVFSARYGADEPPQEDISIYICDVEFEFLHEVQIPYSHFERGEEKWHSVSFVPVNVPKAFYLGIDFHATATKGVYVGMDKGARRSHSRFALPYSHVGDLNERADWMIRPHLSPKK